MIGEGIFKLNLVSKVGSFPKPIFILMLLSIGYSIGWVMIGYRQSRYGLAKKYKKLEWIAPSEESIWVKVNQPDNTDWPVVFLKDKSIYVGWISNYTFDPNADNQDFLLKHAKRVDENLNEIYKINGLGVYLNTKDVTRIEYLKGNVKK